MNKSMKPTVSEIVSGVQWAAAIMGNLLTAKGKRYTIHTASAWDKERKDIMGRALWLCEHVITEPGKLIESMPRMLGPHFMGGMGHLLLFPSCRCIGKHLKALS